MLPDAHDWSFGAPVPLGSAFMSAISADLVICLGVRLGYPLLNGAYFGAAKVVRVDIDGAETARNRPGDLNVCADVRVFCEAVSDAWEGGVSQGRAAWGESLRAAKSQSRADLHAMIANHDGKLPHPLELALAIGDVVGPDATIVADGGDILTWGIIGLPALGPGRLLTTGVYLGCLGVGIPFAIAAKVARPDEPVVLLSGDGTFGLNAMEYDTAIRHDIPFVTVVSADGSWGMSRHGQEMHHDGHTVATQLGVRPYHEVVRALGGHGEFVDAPEEIRPAIQRALDSGLPACVNVGIDPTLCSPLTQAMASLGTA
ncbi:MAG: thiamine pyrophosphate-dependent enzyme [Acidimicrobiia bacterium]|nr:thiamine pyrophosphate-dependent enzyme [Acidimicrobiia bacterium]